MPARRERCPGKKAGGRKPPKNEPAGQRVRTWPSMGIWRGSELPGDGFVGIAESGRPLKVADWALPRCSTG